MQFNELWVSRYSGVDVHVDEAGRGTRSARNCVKGFVKSHEALDAEGERVCMTGDDRGDGDAESSGEG